MTAPGGAPPLVFDRGLVRRRRARAAPRLDVHAFLFDWAMDNIAERLSLVRRAFPRILQLGGRGSPAASRAVMAAAQADTLIVFDSFAGTNDAGPTIVGDEEALPFAPRSFDLVVSPLSLHTVNDLPGALVQIRRILKPDGLLLAALPGPATLRELRGCLMDAELSLTGGVSPRVAPFIDMQQAGALLQRAGFALPVVDSDRATAEYSGLPALLRDLRGMGETSSVMARTRRPAGRALWTETARLYAARHGKTGRLPATFDIIFMTGWAPHASQQQALRRGSAQVSLIDVL